MSYYLAILPDEKANHSIRKLIAQVGSLLDSYEIPVKLVKPEKIFLPVLYLGEKLGPLRKYRYSKAIEKHGVLPFRIEAQKVRLGIGQRSRQHIMLGFDVGSVELRNIVYSLSPKLRIKRERKFIPHITLGRISKELITEEYKNINSALDQMNEEAVDVLRRVQWNCGELEIIEVGNISVDSLITQKL